jgi:hypothetical protein
MARSKSTRASAATCCHEVVWLINDPGHDLEATVRIERRVSLGHLQLGLKALVVGGLPIDRVESLCQKLMGGLGIILVGGHSGRP